jgi:diacylglycerol kinase family enzyme
MRPRRDDPLPPPPRVGPQVKVVALLNAAAGAVQHASNDSLESRLAHMFAKHGVAAEIAVVTQHNLQKAAEEAAKRGKTGKIDAVVSGGGDGSNRIVASALAHTSVPLGVLPLGTLNHFAKDLGIPLNLDEAVETIAKGVRRRIDLASVNGEIFINNSSIGIYPYLVSDRDRLRKQHAVAKWLATIPAMLHTLRQYPQTQLTIETKDWTRTYRTPCVFVGNNEYRMELTSLGRRKTLDEGKLFLCVVKQPTPVGFLRAFLHLCLGRLDPARDIERFELDQLTITSHADPLAVALDGDVGTMHPPLHYRSLPGALQVIVPA